MKAKDTNLPVARLAHALSFTDFLENLGAPADTLVRRQGLPLLCKDPSAFVPQKSIWALFDATASREDDLAGWHIGSTVGPSILGPPLLNYITDSATVFQALKKFVAAISSEASHVQMGLVERDHDVLLYTNYPEMKSNPGHQVAQDYELALYIELIRYFIGPSWSPGQIGIEASACPADLDDLYPQSTVLTGQPFGFISIQRSQLPLPVRASNPNGDPGAQLILAKQFRFIDTLSSLLESYISEGYISAQYAANLMGISPRTLFRRLYDNGTTYQHLIDKIRFDRARTLLESTDRSIGDIALTLGFADQAHFSRMFGRICGLTPYQYRCLKYTPRISGDSLLN